MSLLLRQCRPYGKRIFPIRTMMMSTSAAAESLNAAPFDTHVSVGTWTGGWFNSGLELIESGLLGIHEMTGMPWWSCILGTSVAVRLMLMPTRLAAQRSTLLMSQVMQVAQQHKVTVETTHNYRLAKIKSEAEREQQRKMLAIEAQRAFMLKWSELSRKYGVGPFRTLLPVVFNLPIFIAMTSCLRKMSQYPFMFDEGVTSSIIPGFTTEGLLWFTNLAIPDYGLTAMLLITNTAFLEVMFRYGPQPANAPMKGRKFMYYALHGANLLSFLVLCKLPVSLNLFVMASSLITMVETLILRRPSVQRWLLKDVPKVIQ